MYKLLSQQDDIRYLPTWNIGSLRRTNNIQKHLFQSTHNDFRYAFVNTLEHEIRLKLFIIIRVSILEIKEILLALTHLGRVEESKKYLIVAMKSLLIMSQLLLNNKEV
jgi:hypothetical protein